MFIRVVLLININTLQLYKNYQYMFIETICVSVKTHSTPCTLNRLSILIPPSTIQGLKQDQLDLHRPGVRFAKLELSGH